MKIALAMLGIFSMAVMAQQQPKQSWGQWKTSAEPSVQVRAFCDSESQASNSGVSSDWQFQLNNASQTTMNVRWREEHFDGSSGANRMTSASVWKLAAGETTPVFHSTLLGSCDSLGGIHVMVLPPGSRTFRARRIHQVAGNFGLPVASELPSSTFTGISPVPAAPVAAAAPVEMPKNAQIPGSWSCEWAETRRATFQIAFNDDGQYLITREEGPDRFPGQSEIRGGQVTWADDYGRLYTMRVNGDSMTGRTSTFDMVESRGRDYHGTLNCSKSR